MAKIKAIKLTDLTKDNVKKLISSFDIDLRSKLDEEKRILITELRRKNKRRLENSETDPDTINPKVKDKLIKEFGHQDLRILLKQVWHFKYLRFLRMMTR